MFLFIEHIITDSKKEENNYWIFSFIAERIVNFADVCGHCYVIFGDNLGKSMTLPEWTEGGPYRFYFNQAYDSTNQTFIDPPAQATLIGSLGKVGSILAFTIIFYQKL